jgi:hypothetical protein
MEHIVLISILFLASAGLFVYKAQKVVPAPQRVRRKH